MRRILFLLFFLTGFLFSQNMEVNVQTQFPSPYLSDWMTTPNVIKVTVLNTLPETQTFHIKIKLESDRDGTVFEGVSSNFTVLSGATYTIDNSNLIHFDTGSINNDLVDKVKTTNMIPEGIYTLTLELYSEGDENPVDGPVVENFYVLSFDRPELLAPADQEVIEDESSLIFQWAPVVEGISGFSVRYHLSLFEIKPGQIPFQVISSSYPVFETDVIDNTQLNYPVSAYGRLEKGKQYIWYIQAYNNNPGPNYGATLGENEGRSEIISFFYQQKTTQAVELSDLKRLELVPGVAYLKDLSGVSKNQTSTEYILDGAGSLVYYVQGDSVTVPVTISHLTFLQGSLFPPTFVDGEVMAMLSGTGSHLPGLDNLPIEATDLRFSASTGLTFGANFKIPGSTISNPVGLNGRITLNSAGFSGQLAYHGDWDNPLLQFDHELVKVHFTGVDIDLAALSARADVDFRFFNSDSTWSIPNMRLDLPQINFPINFSSHQTIALIPRSDFLKLGLKTLNGTISLNTSTGSFDFDLALGADIIFPFTNTPSQYPEINLSMSKASGLTLNGFNPHLTQNLGVDFQWMKLNVRNLILSTFQYQAGHFNFDLKMDADFNLPAIPGLGSPIIHDIHFTSNGITIGQQTFSNPSLAPFDLAGLRLEMKQFRVGEMNFNWSTGSMPDWDFAVDVDVTLPNLPTQFASAVRQKVFHLQNIALGGQHIQAVFPDLSFTGTEGEIPLGGGAAYYVKTLGGKLDVDWNNGSPLNHSTLNMSGDLKLPDVFSCSSVQNLTSTTIHMDGFGHISGTISNFVPTCPIKLGFLSLTVNSSSLNFDFSDNRQKALLSAAVSATLPGLSESSQSTSTGNITVDLINGALVDGSLNLTNFALKIPQDQPVLTFHISQATLSTNGLELNGTQQLALGGSSVGVVFDHLLLDMKEFRVISGNAYFNSSFAFQLGISDGGLQWKAIQAGQSLTQQNTMMFNLPANIGISKNGLKINGQSDIQLNYGGNQLDSLRAVFSSDFALQFKPFKVKTGNVDFFYGSNRIAYLDGGGIHFDLSYFGAKALPEKLPLPNESIAYLVLKSGGTSLVDVTTVSDGVRIATKPGSPVRLVIPALQFSSATPPEVGVQFSVTVDPLHFQLKGGKIAAVIPQETAGFDLSKVGLPIKISNLDYRDVSGVKTFTFKGLPALFGANLSETDSVSLTLTGTGQFSSTFNLNLDKLIPLVGGNDLIQLHLNRLNGSINCSLSSFNFDVTASGGLKMKMDDELKDVLTMDVHIAPSGFSVQNVTMDPNLSAMNFNLGVVDMGFSDFTIPNFSYSSSEGWNFVFDFSAKLGFPQLGNFQLPKIEHVRISRQGIHFPETSLPDLNLTPFNMGGFALKMTSLRIPEVTVNFFNGSVDFGSASGIRFDLELNLNNLSQGMPPQLANLGLQVSDCGYEHGIITGTIQNKQIAAPGLDMPIGGGAHFYAKKFRGSLSGDSTGSGWNQKFDVMVEGAFQLPSNLFPCAEPADISAALRINSDGHLSGNISGFVPSCPLSFGPVKLQVHSSSLAFDFSGSEQSAVLAMDASMKLPAPTSGDSVTASGNISLDLVKAKFIDGQIAINTPFRLDLPSEGKILSFTISSAVLNRDGLSISGSNSLNLGGSNVTANFQNFVIGLHPFKIKSGSVSFSSSFAFKVTLENGDLKWRASAPNPTISEDFGVAMNLPSTLGISDGKFFADGNAQVDLKFQGKSYEGLTVNFKDNFRMNLWPTRVVSGKAEFIRDSEVLAYIDSTGFVPGNVLGIIPMPDSIGLPSADVAYMKLKDDQGHLLVETTDNGSAYMLQIKPGKTLKIKIPALKYGSDVPELNVTSLSIGLNKTTHHLVSGGIQVEAPTDGTLLDLTSRGIPLDLTRFAFKKVNGSYQVVLGAKVKLPQALADLEIDVDSLLLSSSGISGAAHVGNYHEHYTEGTTYIKEITLGSDAPVQLKVEGVQTSFSSSSFQIGFSGDMFVDMFKESNTPAPIHFAANVGTDSTTFTTDISHLSGGIPLKIARLMPLANNSDLPPIKISTSGNDFAVEVNTLLKIPSFGENFAVEVRGLKISKNNGLHMPEITFNNPSDFLHFNLFTMQFDVSQLGFFYDTASGKKVFGVELGGNIHFMDNVSSFTGLKIGTDGSFSIAGASLLSSPIDIIPQRLSLKTLDFKDDSLKASFLVTPPEPLNSTPSQVDFFIAPNGQVGGGGTIVLLDEQHGKGNGDATEWTFWKGTLDLVYLNLDLQLNHLADSKVQINGDLWLNNDRLELGYKEGGVVHPGIQMTFDGHVNFSNYRLVGTPKFDLEVLKFNLTNLTSLPGDHFGLSLSGDVALDISSATSTLAFNNLEVSATGGMPNFASSITSGSITIGGVFSFAVTNFEYKPNGGDVQISSGTMPTASSNGTQTPKTIHADSYLQLGVSMSMGSSFSGGVDRFLLFKKDGSPNIIIDNLHLSIQDVVSGSLDMQYMSYGSNFKFLAAGQISIPPSISLTTIGLFEKENGKLRFGIFATAELPGPGIVLFPGISLAKVGGGFFYNPKQEYLDMVVHKTDLASDPILSELPKLNGEAKFAVMLYAGVVIMDKSVVSGTTLITITDQYINFAGRVSMMNLKDKVQGGFKLTARFDQFYIDGIIFAKVKIGVVKGNGQMQFKIAEDQWYVKGKFEATVINPKFLKAESKFFIGNPGFMFQASSHSGFDFWIVSVNTTVSGMVWMKWQEPREFGAYFTYGAKAEVLMGLASISAEVKAILIVTDHYVLYGEADGSVCVCWGLKCWDGSIWVKVSNVDPKFDGGFGSDPEMSEKINDAENMADDMENAAKEAESDMQNELIEKTQLTQDQVERAGLNLYANNPKQIGTGWRAMENNNGGLQSSENNSLYNYINNYMQYPSNLSSTPNILVQLLAVEKSALQDAENIAQQVSQVIDVAMESMPPVDQMLNQYEMDSPVEQFSDSVNVVTYTDAEGHPHQSFSVQPALAIDQQKVNEHKNRAAEMEQTRQHILAQIYARILVLNRYLNKIDAILNAKGNNSINAMSEKYQLAREKLERYFYVNHQFIYSLHSWAQGKMSGINGEGMFIRNFLNNKNNRLSTVEALKQLAKARARSLADVIYPGAPSKADGVYQNLEANIDQIEDATGLRTICFNLGNNLWYDVPKSGLTMLATQFDSAVVANVHNQNDQVGALEARQVQITQVLDHIYDMRISYAQALYDLTDRYLYWQLGGVPDNEISVVSSSGVTSKLHSYIDQNLLSGYSQSLGGLQFSAGVNSSALSGIQLGNAGSGTSNSYSSTFTQSSGVMDLGKFTTPKTAVIVKVGPNFMSQIFPDVKVIHDRLALQLVAPKIKYINVNNYKAPHTAQIYAAFKATHPAGIANYSYTISNGQVTNPNTTSGTSGTSNSGFVQIGSGNSIGLINFSGVLYQSMLPENGIYSTSYKMIGKNRHLHSYFIPQNMNETSRYLALKVRARSTSGYVNRRLTNFTVHFDGTTPGVHYVEQSSMSDDSTPPIVQKVSVPAYQYNRDRIMKVHVDAADYESDVMELAYAVGDRPTVSGQHRLNWHNVGPRVDFNILGLSLQHNHSYYVYVKAKNSVDLWSSVKVSNPVKVDTTSPGRVTVTYTSPYPSDQQSSLNLQDAVTGYDLGTQINYQAKGKQYGFIVPNTGSGQSSSTQSSGDSWSVLFSSFNYMGGFNFFSGDTIPPGLRVRFSPASDAESGIQQYVFKVTRQANDPNPNTGWHLLGQDESGRPLREIKLIGQPLAYLDSFYVHIRAMNRAGILGASVSAGPIRPLDRTKPVKPEFSYGVNPADEPYYISAPDQIVVGIKPAVDHETGIRNYEYKIGTSPGGSQITGWTSQNITAFSSNKNLGTRNFPCDMSGQGLPCYTGFIGVVIPGMESQGEHLKITNLNLSNGQTIYLSLRAVNGDGLRSPVVTSKKMLVDFTPPPAPLVSLSYDYSTHKMAVSLLNYKDAESKIYGLKVGIWGASGSSEFKQVILPYGNEAAVTTFQMDHVYDTHASYTVRSVVVNRANLKSAIQTMIVTPANLVHVYTAPATGSMFGPDLSGQGVTNPPPPPPPPTPHLPLPGKH